LEILVLLDLGVRVKHEEYCVASVLEICDGFYDVGYHDFSWSRREKILRAAEVFVFSTECTPD
jgi:hypothetical protein